jgi:predicted O-methyltransferase YrrM
MENELKFDLGENWFTNEKLLTKTLDKYFKKDTPLHFLEIGSWKGRSAIWFLENYLKHKDSKLYCVDTWDMSNWNDFNQEKVQLEANSARIKELKLDSLYEQFLFNIQSKGFKDKCIPVKKKSVLALAEFEDNFFDFIYIDGDHSEKGCYEDLTAAWPKVKEGGIMFGDDWTWSESKDDKPVQKAAKRFAKEKTIKIRPLFRKGNGYYFIKK